MVVTTYGCFKCGRDMDEVVGPQICGICKDTVRRLHKTVLRQHRTSAVIKFYGRCKGCGVVSENFSTAGMVSAWAGDHLDAVIKIMEEDAM